jgi:L-alanine-DL-glutamate epimerase-like enolase superfamily enzyme
MKCGSIEEALEMVTLAKKYNLKIMLGCMVETSVGITAAASIASIVDKVDLDGNLLIKNDPFEGVKVVNGKISLPNSNGLGLKLISKNNNLL